LADLGIGKNTDINSEIKKEMMIVCGVDLSGSGNGPVARPLVHCNEYFLFIKGG